MSNPAQAPGTPAGTGSPRRGPPEIVTEFDQDEDYSLMPRLAESPRQHRPEFQDWDVENTAAVPPAPVVVPPPTRPARVAAAPDRTTNRAAKLSPQEDDMKDWASIKDTYEWVGIKPRDEALITSLLALLRYEPDDPLIELAAMEPDDFDTDLKDWMIADGQPARAGDKNQSTASITCCPCLWWC